MTHRTLAGVVVAVMLLGGCGIPDESQVTEVGAGPSTGTSTGDGSSRARVTRDSTSDRRLFVTNYLRAAAGDYDGALERVKQFMSAAARADFNAPTAPRVIRLTDEPLVNQDRVTVNYELIGTLGKNGLLEPATEATEGQYEITLGEVTGDGLYVTSAPPFLLLSTTALDDFYEERTIYFWNTEHTALVPDVRYLLGDVPSEQEPTIILNWLLGGPALWLQDAVEPLPDGTKLQGNVPAIRNDQMEIALSAQAVPTKDAEEALDRLRRQLQWSLRGMLPQFLDLKIGHQEARRYSGIDYLSSNPANRLVTNPERFVIFDRTIRRLAERRIDDPDRGSVDGVPGLATADNKDVSRAALSTAGPLMYAALVTGTGKTERLRVGGAQAVETIALRQVTGLPSGIGHPVWAITPEDRVDSAVGLVIAGGKLWRFRGQGGPAQQVSWPGEAGPITAISVAPDGHRAALVVGGRLYRAVLTISGDGLALTGMQQLDPPLKTVTAVDFSGEGWLTVAGERNDNGRVTITDVSIDGALQSPVLADIGREPVLYVTSYPANPSLSRRNGTSVLYSTRDYAWEALSTNVQITEADLAGPAGQPREGVEPTAPLFLN
ncbi:MAG TPA: LpqB family beta-propeller domain-containing protein [Actinoplanes sp.]|nr:LpqB family beta-propeller domain-containing protein [Actinoplanes sp.]